MHDSAAADRRGRQLSAHALSARAAVRRRYRDVEWISARRRGVSRTPSMEFGSSFCNLHCRIVGLDIQLINGIAGNTQPNPASTYYRIDKTVLSRMTGNCAAVMAISAQTI